ncbi:hypothetical protein OUZ56_005956 [Daphnia magna]|uniref:Uncharacterized protein n=1 Tax=Daphnia magna TaxID=35525 RepID=A0ABQ9YU84_9CRUS|nr:hypothetical protein OUZ56_005956 [Daphnia magna]
MELTPPAPSALVPSAPSVGQVTPVVITMLVRDSTPVVASTPATVATVPATPDLAFLFQNLVSTTLQDSG